ncbi:ABC transporter permease subunit [Dongia sp.]|uniref:ABC transporter permease n=1 Tax=Dongia sp. TaxID=1977262 RepID=UPI0035AF3AB5
MTGPFADTITLRGPLAGIAWTALSLQVAIFAAPLLLVLWLSLMAEGAQPADLSLTAWTSLLGSREARIALSNSLSLAALTALLTTFLAMPLAYLVAIRGRFLGRLLLGFVILMWFLDPGMRILGWMQAFKDLAFLELLPAALLAGFPAELIASIHAWLPLSALALAAGFSRICPALLDAARECGATGFGLLHRIVWPLSRRTVALTVTLVFCGSIGSFLEPRLLGTGEFEQASEWLQRALESETGWPYAASMLLLMLLLASLPLALALFLIQRRRPAP